MGDGSPAVLGGKVEHDVVAIPSGPKKSGGGDGPALAERRHANIFLVRLQRDYVQWFRHLHFGLQEKLAEDFAHLFQAQADFAAFFFTRVGEDGKMCGTYADPLGFGIARKCGRGRGGGEEQDQGKQASRAKRNAAHVRPG